MVMSHYSNLTAINLDKKMHQNLWEKFNLNADRPKIYMLVLIENSF